MSNDCIIWPGKRTNGGYGYGSVTGGERFAHRVTWASANGPIPLGMVICHKCDNPPCVNLDHLFLGTQSENILDAYSKGRIPLENPFQSSKTSCPRGHEYDAGNTYVAPRGGRNCRECRREASRQYRSRKAAQK